MLWILFRYLWTSPNTLLGIFIALINRLSGGKSSVVAGVLEIHGPFAQAILKRFVPLGGRAMALTLGHVVLGADEIILKKTRSHERIHVQQYEKFGIFFLPLYLFATLVSWGLGKRPYRDNWFEKEAYSKTSIED